MRREPRVGVIHVRMTAVAAMAAVLALVGGCTQGNVFSLEVGDCFQQPDGLDRSTITDDDRPEISDVPVVDCAQSHDHEVYAVTELSLDGDWPGTRAVDDEAVQLCEDAFEPYVGRDYLESAYYFLPLQPTQASWSDGDRGVACSVYLPDGPSEGSAKGSGQ